MGLVKYEFAVDTISGCGVYQFVHISGSLTKADRNDFSHRQTQLDFLRRENLAGRMARPTILEAAYIKFL